MSEFKNNNSFEGGDSIDRELEEIKAELSELPEVEKAEIEKVVTELADLREGKEAEVADKEIDNSVLKLVCKHGILGVSLTAISALLLPEIVGVTGIVGVTSLLYNIVRKEQQKIDELAREATEKSDFWAATFSKFASSKNYTAIYYQYMQAASMENINKTGLEDYTTRKTVLIKLVEKLFNELGLEAPDWKRDMNSTRYMTEAANKLKELDGEMGSLETKKLPGEEG